MIRIIKETNTLHALEPYLVNISGIVFPTPARLDAGGEMTYKSTTTG